MGGSSDSGGAGYWQQPLPNLPGGVFYPNMAGRGDVINPDYAGLPGSFPMSSLTGGLQNLNSLYSGVGQQAPGFYDRAQQGVTGAVNQSLPQLQSIYGQGVGTQGQLGQQAQGQIAGLENQNLGQVQGMLDKFNQNYLQRLGPTGDLGQQMAGEFNNYGITPTSGAFQDSLGKQMANLGAQNALTLGQEALMPGINAQYGTLGQTLGSQLGTAQQGTQQAGQLVNAGGAQNINLASQGALSPLNYMNQALGQQAPLVNEMAQAPVDWWNFQNNTNFANAEAQQNAAAQRNAAQMGMAGQLGGSGIGALGALAAAGK